MLKVIRILVHGTDWFEQGLEIHYLHAELSLEVPQLNFFCFDNFTELFDLSVLVRILPYLIGKVVSSSLDGFFLVDNFRLLIIHLFLFTFTSFFFT